MSVKIKAWDYLDRIRRNTTLEEAGKILISLIENGTIHADEVWNAEQLIDAYESVMGDGEL